MAALTKFTFVTTTGTGATFYASTFSAPADQNVLIYGVSVAAVAAATAACGIGLALGSNNANLFALEYGEQSYHRDFVEPVILPAGATLNVWAVGFASGTNVDVCLAYRQQ